MKRVIAILIVVCLLLCGCQAVTPTSTEPAIESAQTTTEATEGTIKEATTEALTEVTTTPVTEPEQTQPSKVTVYLLEKTVFCDNGYSAYFYDDAYNVNTREDYDIENKYLGRVNFIEKDKNGMACMIWEETRTENVHNLTYFEDGKLKEELLNVNESNYTGWQYEYDQKGDVVEKREYFEGILQSTVIYEYNGEELWRVYCEDPEGNHIYVCRVEGGRIIEKVVYSTDSVTGCSYRYEYDENGNLTNETALLDGELIPIQTHTYRAVEVDADRAMYLLEQQKYLLSIT